MGVQWLQGLAVGLALACSATSANAAQGPTKSEIEAIYASPDDDALFDAFLTKVGKATLQDGATPRTLYVWEGDLLVDRATLRALLFSRQAGSASASQPSELKVMTVGGVPQYWKSNRALTYRVERASFTSSQQADAATSAIAAAASAWEAACSSCGVTIRPAATNATPTFVVRFDKDETDFIAAAFFPNDPVWRRQVIIAPDFFTTSFDKTGVLRHELGHVLGYRHEHIAGIPGCFVEDSNWKPLTNYDPKSVMHYFCGGGGSMDLKLSPTDLAGHSSLYKP